LSARLYELAIPDDDPVCAPFNPFGVGRSSEASLNYILSPIDNQSSNRQFVFTADLSGPLFKLPGGDLSAAVGFEHRAEGTSNTPDAFYHGLMDPLSMRMVMVIRPTT
jgi:hypothetical protein